MSVVPPTPSASSANFQSVLNVALERYESKTKNKLLTHPLAAQLQACDNPAAIQSVLAGIVQNFDQRRSGDERLTKWLDPTVEVLYSFSCAVGGCVGMVFSPANAIFAGIGVLFLAAKDVHTSQDMLVDLFVRIENFFRRLESYTEVTPTPSMMDIIVKIMVEVLTILAIATTDVKQKRAKKIMKRLMGKHDIEDALMRLDTLTQDEARMATLEVLKVARSIENKVQVVIEDGKDTKVVLQQNASEAKVIMQQNANEAKVIMQQTINNVAEVDRKLTRQDLRRWLSPPDPSTNHNVAHRTQHEGTAMWFFEGDIYEQWRSTPSLLWIHGKPGSGKSVLCSAVIEDILALRESGLASVAYFYCDFRDEDKQNHYDLLLSILFQLSAQSDLYFDVLSRFYLNHDEGSRKPKDAALMQCLKEMLSIPGQPVYLIVDALDECPHNSGMPSLREQLLDAITELAELSCPSLHICVTSRPEVDIAHVLDPLTSLRFSLHEQRGQKKDIIRYVSSVVNSDTRMRRWREEDKMIVIDTLSERADGMFRWVYCQLEALRYSLPPSVRSILDDLPETLDETYERVLKDIHKANREHALRLLQCLTVALRPLRVEELAEVLAVDFNMARNGGIPKINPDWRWADQHQAVLSTCSSLIAVVNDGESRVVQFSHFSVKEFLTSERLANLNGDVSLYHILLEPAHAILTQVCLSVLLRLDDNVDSHSAAKIPLAQYAAEHWVNHAQFEDVASRIPEVLEYFFDADKPHWTAWIDVHDIDKPWVLFTTPNGLIPGSSPLYYAALCGFYDVTKYLIGKHPEDTNTKGGQVQTPLVAALLGKHFRVAELLYEHGAEVDIRGWSERSPLYSASIEGRVDMVRWLLNHGADVNGPDARLRVPLYMAAYRGHLEIIQLLLEHGADVNFQNGWGEVPLHRTASPFDFRDQLKIMKLLLDSGAEVDARNYDLDTPLHESSWWQRPGRAPTNGSVEGSRMLIEHGADIHAVNGDGKTPLQLALDADRQDMAEFLKSVGATH